MSHHLNLGAKIGRDRENSQLLSYLSETTITIMRIIFMGTPEFAVASLKALHQSGANIVGVITAADSVGGRKGVNTSAVKRYALEQGLHVMQPPKLKNPDFLAELRALKADVQVVVAFRMLPEVVWNMPPHGTINLHGSLLPKYRGAAPIHWAVINGETVTGVTTFRLKHEIDTGDVLFRAEISIHPNETTSELHDRMMVPGADLIVQTLAAVADGTAIPIPQLDTEVTHAPKLFTETCRIDWAHITTQVHNFIRGLSLWPGAWTTLDNKSIKILKSAATTIDITAAPGQIIVQHKTDLFVGTKDGAIQVYELQPEGRKKMTAQEFLNGYRSPESKFI
jgi:methionyl-tRNA formyltransferase